jgi:hypothetical protein
MNLLPGFWGFWGTNAGHSTGYVLTTGCKAEFASQFLFAIERNYFLYLSTGTIACHYYLPFQKIDHANQ